MENIKEYLKNNAEELFRIHKELCLIPAPSHFEDERAEYCKAWLESIGAKGVYIDEAKNVVFPMNCENSNKITVINAHTDTVFPKETPLDYIEDGDIVRCPGAGDDTACLAVMLMTVKYFFDTHFVPKNGILFVCNSCEEGLGNLKGIRRICKDFEGRIYQHIAIDGLTMHPDNRCVGSHRYEVTVKTEGGHSFGKFGNTNAIAEAAKIISEIYMLEVPQKTNTKTTYNVGTIFGGTSVNTIAQQATFLCEYRSDDVNGLNTMKKAFDAVFAGAQNEKVKLEIKSVGERPCAENVDQTEIDRLVACYDSTVNEVVGAFPTWKSASTDCNIPLSLGIPSICIGVGNGGGAHTLEEWIEKSSLLPGTEVIISFILKLFNK